MPKVTQQARDSAVVRTPGSRFPALVPNWGPDHRPRAPRWVATQGGRVWGSGRDPARGRRGKAVRTTGGCPGGRAEDAPARGTAKPGGGAGAGRRISPARRAPGPSDSPAARAESGRRRRRRRGLRTAGSTVPRCPNRSPLPRMGRQCPLTSLATWLSDPLP